MTAWTEDEKARIRAYLGYPSLFTQYEPRLENAIRAVQSTADGGALPSTATQDRMREGLTSIASIEQKITALYCSLQLLEAGTEAVRLDSARAMMMLRSEGQRLIKVYLGIPLDTQPRRDYFFSGEGSIGSGAWQGSPFGSFDR